MAVYRELGREQAAELGAAFGVEVKGFEPIAAGSVNSNYRLELAGGKRAFARIYEEQDRAGAEGEAQLVDHLARHGVPTPRPFQRADGLGGFIWLLPGGADGRPASQGRPVAMFPWFEGESVCQARVTVDVAARIGGELARVHLAGASYPVARPGRFGTTDLRVRLEQIASSPKADLAAMAGPIRRELERVESARDPALPRGVIHGDLFRDNVLWKDGRPVALLDFESASQGVLLYDLMVAVLAWCYGSDLEAPLVRAMLAGYKGVRPLSEGELAQLAVEAKLAALRFTITRITDYAMRNGLGSRVMKDWRRFWARYLRICELGNATLVRLYG